MPSFNHLTLLGNLTRDPELRVTPKGTAICQAGLAVNREFTQDGQKREEVLFIDFEAWGKTGELIATYLTKGSSCLLDGRLKFEQWEDKATGAKRSKLKMVVENVQFLGGGKGAENRPAGEPGAAPKPAAPDDTDVPF